METNKEAARLTCRTASCLNLYVLVIAPVVLPAKDLGGCGAGVYRYRL